MKYRFTKVKTSYLVILTVILLLVFMILKSSFSMQVALIFGFVAGGVLGAVSGRLLNAVVEFHESFLQFRDSVFNKPITIDYDQLKKMTYSNGQNKDFFAYTNDSRIKLPPPSSAEVATQVFEWLRTKNQQLETRIN